MALPTRKRSLPSAKSAGGTFTVRFQQKKETPGAVQYEEVGSDGKVVDMPNAKIGSIYLRKSGLGGSIPSVIDVTVSF